VEGGGCWAEAEEMMAERRKSGTVIFIVGELEV